MKIKTGCRVRLKVKLTAGGDEIERSVVEYIHGSGTMVPGLEKVLEGLEPGASKKGTIKAENAFGDASFQSEKSMSRDEFPADLKLDTGARFTAKGAGTNQDVVLEVVKVEDKAVQVKLLHPLADKDIEYDFEVLQVTDPKPPPVPVEALGAAEEDS